jgi:hypothetical protein
MPTYKAKGSVRGSCGHKHRSIGAALRCAQRDNRDCHRVGGYSDRTVVRCDGEIMTEAEHDEHMLLEDLSS